MTKNIKINLFCIKINKFVFPPINFPQVQMGSQGKIFSILKI